MRVFLLSIVLWAQGIPLQPTQTGTITGVLRNEDGKPAAGVRVAAMPQPESLQSDSGPTLSSLAETDAEGRFKLENVPPGRYYIAAGRLDLPTFYPGTQSMALSRSVQVTPGSTVANIEFALDRNSAGRAGPAALFAANTVLLEVPLNVSIEGGGKLPMFHGVQPTSLKLIGSSGPITVPIGATGFNLYPPVTDYTITIEGLPEGYSVKSVKYGTNELADRTLRLNGFPGPNGATLFSTLEAYLRTMAARIGNPLPSKPPVLSIVLDSTAAVRAAARRRVRGSFSTNSVPRPLYLSEIPGAVFSDGTFEFRDVPPGQHILITRGNSPTSPPLAAMVVVGEEGLDNVQLESTPTPVLPRKTRTVTSSQTGPSRQPGAIPLLSVQGRIIDAETGLPVRAGTVFLVGDGWATYELKAEGNFEFQHLLPGSYEIEVRGVGYPTFRREIVVEAKDLEVELKAG